MTILRLTASLFAVVWGSVLCARHKQPLFFKILLFGCASFLFGALFDGCWTLVYDAPPQGFHIGYLGYVGTYFFLLSAHYGAIDRLADGGEKKYRPYRLAALIAPILVAAVVAWSILTKGFGSSGPLLLMAIPLGMEAFFSMKHLLLPDVEMGIILVMRPYNLCALLLCLAEVVAQAPVFPPEIQFVGSCTVCVLLAAALPLAEMGVRKWYI